MVKNSKKSKSSNESLLTDNRILDKSLDNNITLIKGIFQNDDTLITRRIENYSNSKLKGCLFFIQGMINSDYLSESIIKPFLKLNEPDSNANFVDLLETKVIFSNAIKKTNELDKILEAILIGDTALLLDGYSDALVISSRDWEKRPISEPDTEKVVRGPREGFGESLVVNLSMLRRKIQNPSLKFEFRKFGTETHTKACICYIDGIAPKEILDELNSRLSKIDLDSILDSQYIQEFLNDARISPFETVGSTERPDTVAGKLLEGRIAILVDGTPFALTIPFLFIEYFQVNEDYYNNYIYMSFNRILRIIAAFLTVSVPAIYLSFVTYNQEMIPTPLLLSIYSSRESIPSPTVVECILMLLVFEILRETGTRLPSAIGQTTSIVGALVLGQAAVDARLVSAPIVIVVALTGITGLLNIKNSAATVLLRAIFLLSSAFLGIYGYIFTLLGLIIHLMSIKSFGVPYMLTIGSIKPEYIKDVIVRTPWWYSTVHPFFISIKHKKKRGGKN
ncbi:spore germination protein [Clostridium sp. 'White wine YQ']|uniref:spore germination protein n=1 Tax=Clostridium sp. 'White wine YQ' TaxID=3027474 RepID=UPI002366941D|nr:spore germination protein [Clostridium sp. 'White wine YQ']MDD7792879.1 spore germination protein [Clostridium sp. 'White wine YQ']